MHTRVNTPSSHRGNPESVGCTAIRTMPSRTIDDSLGIRRFSGRKPRTHAESQPLYIRMRPGYRTYVRYNARDEIKADSAIRFVVGYDVEGNFLHEDLDTVVLRSFSALKTSPFLFRVSRCPRHPVLHSARWRRSIHIASFKTILIGKSNTEFPRSLWIPEANTHGFQRQPWSESE